MDTHRKYFSRRFKVFASILFVSVYNVPSASAHPLCQNYAAPFTPADAPEYKFCTHINGNPDGACCTVDEEQARFAKFQEVLTMATGEVTAECISMLAKIQCGPCEPWTAHLYQDLGPTLGPDDGMMLTTKFCERYTAACGDALNVPDDYCAVHSIDPDPYYAYPFDPSVELTLDPKNSMQPAFPNLEGKFPAMMTGLLLRPDANAWFIVDQVGVIWEFENDYNTDSTTVIVSIEDRVYVSGELGLLGCVLHPNFANNNIFYLNYIDLGQNTVISRFTLIVNDSNATAATERQLLTWPQPEPNHNGGWMGFSPTELADPFAAYHHLFIVTGDGGGADDNHGVIGNSQDLTKPYGKMLRLRISVENAESDDNQVPLYTIPPDNPFAYGTGDGNSPMPEIFAYGLRNPWRCSFDRDTDQLYCADVGQDRIEEVNIIESGKNYGWNQYEGNRCNSDVPNNLCNLEYASPIFQYCHEDFQMNPVDDEGDLSLEICRNQEMMGQSITGGFVYRGDRFANELFGQYIFADFETRMLASIYYDEESNTYRDLILADVKNGMGQISAFAEDADGELFLVSYNPTMIYQLPCLTCADGFTIEVGTPGLRKLL